MKITKENTLAEIVKADFKTSEIFESYGLDYCCNGKRSIADACDEKNIDTKELIEKLANLKISNNGDENFNEMELDDLISHILNEHHSYVSKMLPILDSHAEKVYNAHGKNHSELEEVKNIWTDVSNELANHMMKEERMLFPYIVSLVIAKKNISDFQYAPFGTVENPINMMEREHTSAGNAFFRIREITDNYKLPQDACTTFEVFYKELNEFENDLHKHIHLENNILHPKAILLEKTLLNNLNN